MFFFLLCSITDPTEVYTWGNNSNFTLGHGNQQCRQHPELVDVFARSQNYIKQVRLKNTPLLLLSHFSRDKQSGFPALPCPAL